METRRRREVKGYFGIIALALVWFLGMFFPVVDGWTQEANESRELDIAAEQFPTSAGADDEMFDLMEEIQETAPIADRAVSSGDSLLSIKRWGSYGSKGGGQFQALEKIALSPDGHIYAVDSMRNDVQKFTSEGQLVAIWGGDGLFSGPVSVAVDSSGYVYVGNKKSNTIRKLTAGGKRVGGEWGRSGSAAGEFSHPAGIAVDSDGYVYVADFKNHRIQKFTSDGQFYSTWGTEGSGDGQFEGCAGVAVDSSGYIYALDYYNHRVQKFTSDGGIVKVWGTKGSKPGEFNYPYAITVDMSGHVYVADMENHRIQKFNSSGEPVMEFGRCGRTSDTFYYPGGIAVSQDGRIFVSDCLNYRIQVFAPPQNMSPVISKISFAGQAKAGKPAKLTVQAKDKEKDTPIEYLFAWGDGTFYDWSTNKTASHTYTEDKCFPITVMVRDSKGYVSYEYFSVTFTKGVADRQKALGGTTCDGGDDDPGEEPGPPYNGGK